MINKMMQNDTTESIELPQEAHLVLQTTTEREKSWCNFLFFYF